MYLTSFVTGLSLCSETERPFREEEFQFCFPLDLVWWNCPSGGSGGQAPLSYSLMSAPWIVTFKQWLCKIWLVSKKKYSSHPKDWQEPEMAEAVLAFFWRELIGQEILGRAQHRIPSYHSAWLDTLSAQLESLSKIVGRGTSSPTKLYWEKTCCVLIYW